MIEIFSKFSSRSAVFVAAAVVSCATPLTLLAAQPLAAVSGPAQAISVAALTSQPLDMNLRALPGVAYSSSSTSSSLVPTATDGIDMGAPGTPGDALQPPPRRRPYGRPRYTDRGHNADGSNRLAVMLGGGLTVPTGSTRDLLSTGYKFQGGVGVNFDKYTALLLQVDYDHFGVPKSLINAQASVYDSLGFYTQDPATGTTAPIDFTTLGANAHIWSITLNPSFNFYQGDSFGAYAVVGGGLYHKVTNFTLPQQQQGYDYYYGPYSYTVNSTFDKYTSNSAGLNGGIGFTYKPSRFASERLYAEARYVHTFDSAATKGIAEYNFFPAGHNTSNYIPVTVGLRF
jgi:hypothetical protein